MQTKNILTDKLDSLPRGKADFLLAASVTKTCEIEGITQAGIPGKIPYTPTLDAEFIVNEKLYSMPEIAETPSGVPTPALITRAAHNLDAYETIEILDLGLDIKPQNTILHQFGIEPSDAINKGANIDAKEVFAKGMAYGKSYELKGNYLILGESTPSGTTTAAASVLALGYDAKGCFSSSFKDVPKDIRQKTIDEALSLVDADMPNFEKLGIVSDNMLIFCAGFLLEATKRFHVVLGGGTQMAACLLIADKLREDVLMRLNSENLTLATTAWVVNDANSDIKKLLGFLSYTPHAVYTELSFSDAEIPVLKKYDEGEAKEGVGAGAALAYANANGQTNKSVVDATQLIMYGMM
ncbi:nicotinate-nucleotide--dimethylbenzimidazole phosphoribosyltransferase [Sulfurimonas lithotrophica]|uniref:Nicotinate-nucleotide--dimethylbenzimidazole phosphoribosyltransferase n=1 Tax=Sulfurimonas lithotrophica TaxID=2590022 RepID=A0A5P8NXY3_9BACT|nr:nicotinate-nucleotide--dimethylbenzimidazole phosphoribosyltransferase [Sulfurimonas lithotrophica]QFR48292.1 nicotinate-nucleotide--dimethylbenzimidazole phosphoribosyltransferase [Sulfurimonas lithotrophica]